MPLSIVCGCGKRLRVSDEAKGKKVRCPGCKALLTAEESAAPPRPTPAVTTKTKTTPQPTSKDAASAPAGAKDLKAKKSSAVVFWILGCLGLAGSGIAAVVVIIIIAIVSHKSFKDKLVGEWVLDKAECKRLSMDVPRSYADIRYKFEKNGACTLHCENRDVPKTWQVTAEKSGNGPATLELILNTPTGDSPMPSKIYFWSDDRIEITFPINCILRRATAAPDGKLSAVADAEAIRCYDPATGRELATWKPDLRQPHLPGCVVFSPDGKKLATGSIHASEPGTIVLLDVEALLKPKS